MKIVPNFESLIRSLQGGPLDDSTQVSRRVSGLVTTNPIQGSQYLLIFAVGLLVEVTAEDLVSNESKDIEFGA